METFRGGVVTAIAVAVIDYDGWMQLANIFNTRTMPAIAPPNVRFKTGDQFFDLALIEGGECGLAICWRFGNSATSSPL